MRPRQATTPSVLVSSATAAANISAARRLATSPARCPPNPSATAQRSGADREKRAARGSAMSGGEIQSPTTTVSSFRLRTRPRWVNAAICATIVIVSARYHASALGGRERLPRGKLVSGRRLAAHRRALRCRSDARRVEILSFPPPFLYLIRNSTYPYRKLWCSSPVATIRNSPAV